MLDEKDYVLNLVEYLESCTYGYYSTNKKDLDYTYYAAFLLAASGTTYQENDYPDNYLKKFPANRWITLRHDSPAKSFRQYNIPILGLNDNTSDSNFPQRVIGNLMIPSLVEIDPFVLSVYYEKTSDLLNKISHYEKIVLAQKAAVRSAIAQVMARNLSHNYGSHVLNHLLRATLGTFAFRNNPYKSLYNSTLGVEAKKKELYWQIIYLIRQLDEDIKTLKIKEVNDEVVDKLREAIQSVSPVKAENLTNETLRQIVYFLSHLKCRVDYISDISFGAPTIQTSRRVYGDIFKELDRVSLLMNHISGLEEHFEYEIHIEGLDNKKLDGQNDLLVAIPNDVVGTHAFYNILENIIRNTAKHSQGKTGEKKTGKSIVFIVVFSNIDTTDFTDTLDAMVFSNDNTEDKALKSKLKEEAQGLYCVEIFDTICLDENTAENLVNAQNKRLNEPVFEGERPRGHSLGLVEMEASAAYLRKLSTNVIDDELFHVINKEEDSEQYNAYKDLYYNPYGQFNLLKAIMKQADEKGKYYFGYRFFMLRPQEVLMVVDDDQEQKFSPLHNPKEGVWIVTKAKFIQTLSGDKVFNHEFVVYEDEDVKKHTREHKTALSPRVLKRNIKDWLDNNTSPNDIIKECWQQWQEKERENWSYSDIYGSYGGISSDAIYLNHLSSNTGKTDKYSFEESKYCEALSSNAQGKLPCFHHKDIPDYLEFLDKNKTIKIKNLESINNRILIVDERIQDAAYKQSVYGYLLMKHYKRMGVTVPEMPEHENEKEADDNKFNLLEKDFSLVAEKIKNYIYNNCKSFDFVLIHYGILERIFKAETATSNKEWKELLDDYLKKLSQKGPRIILTSGRGVPSKLPSCVGFVSLSSVTAALIDYKSKYMFNCLMYAARKTAK